MLLVFAQEKKSVNDFTTYGHSGNPGDVTTTVWNKIVRLTYGGSIWNFTTIDPVAQELSKSQWRWRKVKYDLDLWHS